MNIFIITMLLFFTGIASGFMNTVASSGTALTLPVMIFLGIPPSIANATNRIPLLVGCATATFTFNINKSINWIQVKKLIIPVVLGTIIGCATAQSVDEKTIKSILIVTLFISAAFILLKPSSLIAYRRNKPKEINILSLILMFAAGIWGGLIVLDVFTIILFSLVLYQNIDIQKANGIKVVLGLTISIVSTIYFGINNQINWTYGLILSIGSVIGSYAGTKFALNPKSRIWIYRIILTVITSELILLALKTYAI